MDYALISISMRTIVIRTTCGQVIKGELCPYDNLFESILNMLTNYGYNYSHLKDYSIS